MMIKARAVRLKPNTYNLRPSFYLQIEFFVGNHEKFYILDSRVEVCLKKADGIEKRLGWSIWDPSDPQEGSIQDQIFTLRHSLTMDYYILERIEELRAGGDLSLLFKGFLFIGKKTPVITEIVSHGMQAGRKIPEDWKDTYLYSIEKQSFGIASEIPRSIWVDILNTIGAEEIRLVELRFPKQGEIPDLKRAFERLNRAISKYHFGDYKGAVIESREVVQEVEKLKAIGERNYLAEAMGERKFEKANDLLAKIRDFSSMAGHEASTEVEFHRSDARFLIEIVGSLLNYVNAELLYKSQYES